MAIHLVTAPTPPAAAAHPPGRLDYRQAVDELIVMGTELARLVHGQAVAAPETAAAATIAFTRIARCVRRSVLLARKLAEPLTAPADPASAHRDAARRRIIRGVEDVIQRAHDDDDDGESAALHQEFLDRLDSPDFDDDLAHLSVPEIIADICRDLGLAAPPGTHPWKRRTPADIAALCARAAQAPPPRTPPPPPI